MYPNAPSYRLGDMAKKGLPDGDYMVRITALEPAKTKDGDDQIKLTSVALGGAANGQTHQWWWNLKSGSLFRIGNDLIAAGMDPNADLGAMFGPPGPNWATALAPALVGRGFQIKVSTNKEFTNTAIIGPIQLGPDGMPVAFGGPAPVTTPGAPYGTVGTPTSPTGPAHGVPASNVPQQVPQGGFPPAMSYGNATPVNPGAPPAAASTGYVDASSLFRTS